MVKFRIKNRVIAKFLTHTIAFCLIFASPCFARDSGTFTGTWVANGTRDNLQLDNGRTASTFRLSGHVNLQSLIGGESDFWSECIGLTDSETGSTVRCLWKGTEGNSISLILMGKTLQRGTAVAGEIVGGSGTFSGISGTLSLHWSTMSVQSENGVKRVGGYAKDLKGAFKMK